MGLGAMFVAAALAGSPATGLLPLGAAPLDAGQGTVTVSGGGIVAAGDFGFGQTGGAVTATYAPHERVAFALIGAGQPGGLDRPAGAAVGLLARGLLVNAPHARFALLGGAAVGLPQDLGLGFPLPVLPMVGFALDVDSRTVGFDFAVGFPWILDTGFTLGAGRGRARLGLTTGLPTIGYRYRSDRFFLGFDLASILFVNAAWVRVGGVFGPEDDPPPPPR